MTKIQLKSTLFGTQNVTLHPNNEFNRECYYIYRGHLYPSICVTRKRIPLEFACRQKADPPRICVSPPNVPSPIKSVSL